MDDPIVITGAGVMSALGLDGSALWDGLVSGKSGVGTIEGYDVSGFPCPVAAQIRDFNIETLDLHPRDTRIMNKHSHMLMKCSLDAWDRAGLNNESNNTDRDRIGLYAGMGMVDYEIDDLLTAVSKSMDQDGRIDYDRFFSRQYRDIYPLWPLSMLNNISFCLVAIRLGISGDNTVFSPHADSGVQAIAEAVSAVQTGKAAAAVAGGVSEKVTPLSLARGHLLGFLNDTTDPSGMFCRPLGTDKNSTVLGEGCGMLVIERQSIAKERGGDSTAAITGYGFAHGLEEEEAAPTKEAISQAMENALAMAATHPEEIDVLIANGDGTAKGNRNEIEAVKRVFSKAMDRLNLFSSRGALGHLFAAASVVDAIIGLAMMENSLIPATVNSANDLRQYPFELVAGKPKKMGVKKILINGLSFEGQCASLIMERIG